MCVMIHIQPTPLIRANAFNPDTETYTEYSDRFAARVDVLNDAATPRGMRNELSSGAALTIAELNALKDNSLAMA